MTTELTPSPPELAEALIAAGLPVAEAWTEPTFPPSHYIQIRHPDGPVLDVVGDTKVGWGVICQLGPSATGYHEWLPGSIDKIVTRVAGLSARHR